MLAAFVGESPLGTNHKNGIKSDNRIENLEYSTNGDNCRHAWRTGLSKSGELQRLTASKTLKLRHADGLVTHSYGVASHHAKLNPDIVRAIRASVESNGALAKRYSVSKPAIRYVRSRKTWKHVQ